MIPLLLKLAASGAAATLLYDILKSERGEIMHNCHEDMLAFHNQDVTLPYGERTEMRQRRDTNRNRLKSGLKRDGEPTPIGCHSQGSYAMRTMVQQSDRDYDIDDGVYFDKGKLKGPKGGDRTPGDAKEMVLKALNNQAFKRSPEKLKNCVRVYYDAGYHVDVPVYRRVTDTNALGEEETWYELASSEWKHSDALAVTDWLLDANKVQSPETDNGGQLRRLLRLLKAFARSRESWRSRIATGFMITKLVVEKYRAAADREDRALYDTMVATRDRLNQSLEIAHPTINGEWLTKGPDDAQAQYLLEKLDWAIEQLAVLFDPECTRKQALKAWDKVFATTFFSERDADHEAQASKGDHAGAAVPSGILIRDGDRAATEEPVDKRGGGRYA